MVFGEKHLRYLLSEYLEFYHQSRPHQGLGNALLTGEAARNRRCCSSGTLLVRSGWADC